MSLWDIQMGLVLYYVVLFFRLQTSPVWTRLKACMAERKAPPSRLQRLH